MLHRKFQYHITIKNETNDNVSIGRLKVAYLEEDLNYVNFPTVHLKDNSHNYEISLDNQQTRKHFVSI